jgi:gamma-glutamylcyclotransferase (GGCT)/AIG2-like uncharacterized protein YtfP
MPLHTYLQTIQIHLIRTHARVLAWFDESDATKHYRPADGGWTIMEILEHIALTSHFLMILIEKGTRKALEKVDPAELEAMKQTFHYDLGQLDEIGIHQSFAWVRPEHMEPKGEKTETEIKNELIEQLHQCLGHLDTLKNGEGLLYKTTMTVNGLGKINVYEYIYFLSKHAERHIGQMEGNWAES